MPKAIVTCTHYGCQRAAIGESTPLCDEHWATDVLGRTMLRGEPLWALADPWFAERTVRAGLCIVWTRSLNEGGYGQHGPGGPRWAKDNGIRQSAMHRLAYEVYVDPIPADHHVHHLCGVRPCVRPDHLAALPSTDHLRMHGGSQSLDTPVRMSNLRWA